MPMWSSVANLKESLSKIAHDVHDDDDEELSMYTSPPRDQSDNGSSGSERRISRNFTRSNTPSPIVNGFDSPSNHEIEQYKTEIKRLQESEAEIKALSVNYAALLKEKEMNPMNPMGFPPFNSGPPPWAPAPAPPPWPPSLPPLPPPSASFWTTANVSSHSKDLNKSITLAKLMEKESEMLFRTEERGGITEGEDKGLVDMFMDRFSKSIKDKGLIEFEEPMPSNTENAIVEEPTPTNAKNAILSKLIFLLEPLRVVTDGNIPWEEKSAVKGLADKKEKYKRNKLWWKRKRRRIAENLAKEREQFDKMDKEADEWREREVAKDIAQRKAEKMEEIAKLKAKEEKKRLEEELELVLIVEKLQELRSMRIQKLKKQGHFLPEEDDEFLERVRAAVEEEERLSMAAADTAAAKDAIATAEESRKHIQSRAPDSEELNLSGDTKSQYQKNETAKEGVSEAVASRESKKPDTNGPGSGSAYDSVANLPMEFYHYYHGSNTDMGTLIEVRRTWDAYIRPGGSRIPGHWVQPPPPADDIWASYLVKPK